MQKKLIVNCDSREFRVAVVEDKRLVELHIERPEKDRVVGNIYNGQVSNILPGMQAAFIDIGLDKNAFLYILEALPSDVAFEYENVAEQVQIKNLLNQGQKVMVQVIKEPFGTKGARVSTNISIPGRFLVLMPASEFIGISKKIESDILREELRELGNKLFTQYKIGMILRTAAKDASYEQLAQEYKELHEKWQVIEQNSLKQKTPSLIYQDLKFLPRILRDILSNNIDEIIIDKHDEYLNISKNIDKVAAGHQVKVTHYKNTIPIFDFYGIEEQINKALRNKVWLDNGGYLVIDRTEALTVIDVNTGKFIGKQNLEETVVSTNIEAAKEAAYQLRLRNLSGIIIIDFIDMHIEANQQKVLQVLEQELKKDSNKTSLLGITKLGLVEITRKKIRKSLHEIMYEKCPTCNGLGSVATDLSVANKIDREVRNYLRHTREEAIIIEMHEDIVELFVGEQNVNLNNIETNFSKKIYIKSQRNYDKRHEYNIMFAGDEIEVKKILQQYL